MWRNCNREKSLLLQVLCSSHTVYLTRYVCPDLLQLLFLDEDDDDDEEEEEVKAVRWWLALSGEE